MTQIVEHDVPAGRKHLVQFYGTEPSVLIQNVTNFIDEGLQRGDSVLAIATPDHSDAMLAAMSDRRGLHMRSRQLVVLDAQATLDQIMCEGAPDWRRFEQVVGGMIRGLRRANPNGGLRGYGEMVGILWSAGQIDAAIQLEKFWNVLLGGEKFSLFCGYPIDVFTEEFHNERVHDVLCAHSHVLPSGTISAMESALDRSIREVLGDAARIRSGDDAAGSGAELSSVEAAILRLRTQEPQFAREILSRARDYYRACA